MGDPNVYGDTSGSISEMDAIDRMVEATGAERILFGTDNSDLSFCRGKIQGANLTDQQRTAIYWRNALRLLGSAKEI